MEQNTIEICKGVTLTTAGKGRLHADFFGSTRRWTEPCGLYLPKEDVKDLLGHLILKADDFPVWPGYFPDEDGDYYLHSVHLSTKSAMREERRSFRKAMGEGGNSAGGLEFRRLTNPKVEFLGYKYQSPGPDAWALYVPRHHDGPHRIFSDVDLPGDMFPWEFDGLVLHSEHETPEAAAAASAEYIRETHWWAVRWNKAAAEGYVCYEHKNTNICGSDYHRFQSGFESHDEAAKYLVELEDKWG